MEPTAAAAAAAWEGDTAAPRVRLRYRTAVGVQASRPGPPASQARQRPPTQAQVLDLLVAALARLAPELGQAPSGPQDPRWPRGYTPPAPASLLDALMAESQAVDFPYPGSPRLGGTGGGRQVAEDGSPGLPAAWLRYLQRGERAHAPRAAERMPYAPLLLAQAAVARQAPDVWDVYRAYVSGPMSARALARARGVAPSTISRTLARARGMLLAELAYAQGELDAPEYQALTQALAT